MKKPNILLAASVFMAAALAAGEKGDGSPPLRFGGGEKWPKMDREGRPGERIKNLTEENLPGAKEELARHQEAMKAIQEKAKALAQAIKAASETAATPEARREVGKSYEPKIRAIAAEIVDERLNHEQKMLDLRKANREQAVNMAFKFIIMRALGEKLGPESRPLRESLREKMHDRREKRESENRGANAEKRQPLQKCETSLPPAEREEGEPSAPPPPSTNVEQAIADELAEALEQALR